jgi:CBS domain-containing protein
MPSNICEESFFFLHIDSICRSPAITCGPDASVVSAAKKMSDQDITGIVVTVNQKPVGILTVRDLRDLIANAPSSLSEVKVRDIMHVGLITVRHHAYVFEAIFKMAKHNIHRLAVVDAEKNLVGVVTDTDLLSLQTRSPLYLTQEMEAAESIEELREINARILDMVGCAMGAGAATQSLVQLISHFNDTLTQRIIELLDLKENIRLPKKASYLALGSEGRGEQTLRTDQDSAMVYADDISPEELEECVKFAERLVDALDFVGVARCPGNTMASNPEWRHSLTEWKRLLERWISIPKGEYMVSFGMFQDFRTIHGDTAHEDVLHEHLLSVIERNNLFFPYVAKNIVRFPAPIGMFGRIKVDRSGKNRGKIELKKAGIFAITEGVSLLALEHGVHVGTTWDKLEELSKLNVLSTKDSETISESFTTLVRLRLQRQLNDITAGKPPGNSIEPMLLTEKSRNQLREALRGTNQLLRIIRDHYRLEFISR